MQIEDPATAVGILKDMAKARLVIGLKLPQGFAYRPEFLTTEEEQALLAHIRYLDFRAFNFQGYVARRRIVDYGYEYDFTKRQTSATRPIPEFLEPLRAKAAEFAGVAAVEIAECIITEYPPGAPIGWRRDVRQFEIVIGISLAGRCRMRFKPHKGEGKPVSVELEPRSAYIMSGPARWDFQHSIPPVKDLRYSITFRTLRAD